MGLPGDQEPEDTSGKWKAVFLNGPLDDRVLYLGEAPSTIRVGEINATVESAPIDWLVEAVTYRLVGHFPDGSLVYVLT